MPTGYTASVQDGTITTLEGFALRCARAFGTTIMMRDEPLDSPIPERFTPNTSYHDTEIARAKKALEGLPLLSDDECQKETEKEYQEAIASEQEQERKRLLQH